MKFQFAKIFQPLLTTEAREIDLFSGRAGGKSFAAADLVLIYMMKYPFHDIVMARCNAVSLKDSVYAEMVSRIEEHDLKGFSCFTSPCCIKTKTNTIYFEGVGGPDIGRTRSFKPKNPLSLIVVDEVQQLTSRGQIEHAISSFVRHLDSDINSHIMLIGNPPEFSPGTDKGWWWDYLTEQEQNPNAVVIRSNYTHIKRFLSDAMLEKIEFMKKVNNNLFRKIYLAEFDGSDKIAVYNFDPKKHIIPSFPENVGVITKVIVGVDVGVINDCTFAVPIAITSENYLIVLPSYCHDPKKSGVKSIRQQAVEIRTFLAGVLKRYNFNSYYNPLFATVDCAAPEMVLTLKEFGITAYPFKDKNTQGRIEVNNNYFGSNQLYMIKSPSNELIKQELLSNTFIDRKLDKSIPNDGFDALQYGLYYIYNGVHIPYDIKQELLRGVNNNESKQ